MANIPRFEVSYYDEERSPDVVPVGNWELVMAERKFGRGCISAGSLDGILYASYLGAKRAGLVAEGTSYDAWGASVAKVAEAPSGESPTSLED